MKMLPSNLTNFENVISRPRLNSYKHYFRTTSLEETIGLYMWNAELSACFATLLSLFEIAIRNNVHCAMSRFYCKSQSDHWYKKLWSSLKPGTQNKIDEIRYEGYGKGRKLRVPAPSADEIVSRVSFGFWPSVLATIDKRYATIILPAIFPQHPLNANPIAWTEDKHLKSALAPVHELNTFRNRVAHHEPLWKFASVILPSGGVVLESTDLASSLTRFARLLGLFDDTLHALNQDFNVDLKESSWRQKINFLLSLRGVDRYKAMKHCPKPVSMTPMEFQRDFQLLVKDNRLIRISEAQQQGLFIPE